MPTTTHFEHLKADGIVLPEPASIADSEISGKLWEVIEGLAKRRVYLDQTDHLNDRELYAKLWYDLLREETPAIDEVGFNTQIALLMTGSDEDTYLYLKHYADEKAREFWRKDWPDLHIPLHEDPQFNRDVLLPAAAYAGQVVVDRGTPEIGLPWN